ncbi:MAG: SMC-Scp complex subunit ScpB [Candidatus Nomurabacteria bacterium]|nr:SMC-Scp complex subunit ScpB [Candidatus Nomurabacteria bacterium]
MDLEAKIEAILFFKGEPVSIHNLSSLLKVSKEETKEAVINLSTRLQNRGIVLSVKEDEINLGTNPEISELIEKLQKEELNKDLSKSSLETLSIILYKNGISRSEIDYIRGVNSSFILRALSIRGLIEKLTDPKDNRKYIYKPTFELLSFMGIKSVAELPNFTEINPKIETEIQNFEKENESESI